jgi:sulfate adenylyltransferase (ADP) / ATP adenylyltransferase
MAADPVTPHDLGRRAAEVTRRALSSGALEPIATDKVTVEDGGIPFIVHVLAQQEPKEQARKAQDETGTNPFLPPDPDLVVADVSDSHLCLLNRFTVFDHHLLIVTRRFSDQLSLLDPADFQALAACMAEVDGLGFYNAGTVAGASQEHKHLQLVPFPLGSGPLPTPVDAVLGVAALRGAVTRSEALPFPHALLVRDGSRIDAGTADELLARYRELLAAVGIHGPDRPYNLLLTRRWMLLVPRSAEQFEGISVNGLGFAGSLLVRNRRQLDLVRRCGPLQVLASVSG